FAYHLQTNHTLSTPLYPFTTLFLSTLGAFLNLLGPVPSATPHPTILFRQPWPRFGRTAALRLQTGPTSAPSLKAQSGGSAESGRSEEHTSELESPCKIVCRLSLAKK